MRSVLAIILGGGRGTRLFPLTRSRSKPAVPVAGKYRLIDIPISNCINSELHSIYVLTQFLSVSLHRHIANTYKFDMFSHGFVEVLAAQQTNESADWYQGTADAVRQNLSYIERENPDEVLILSGDQLYRMDFRQLIETHRGLKADATIAAIPVPEKDTAGFGLLSMDANSRVTGFVEKPKTAEEREPYYTSAEWIQRRGIPCNGRHYLANMGTYLFKTGCSTSCSRPSPWRPTSARRSSRGTTRTGRFAPTCSTATGRTSARSAATTRRAWLWRVPSRRSTSSCPRA
jgi:glucose-1-phosphate adenylyltransferase